MNIASLENGCQVMKKFIFSLRFFADTIGNEKETLILF